jgi:gamma-glutamyl-gamma-aminobutyrate hydrolase PuuD
MAEAVLAFDIAANVVHFIHFGCKILSEGYQLYHSAQPNSQHNQNIESVASDLEEFTKSLQ